MGKLISLRKYTESVKLSPLMVQALRAACKMQSNHIPFGQANLAGSFIPLLKRGCIDYKTIIHNGEKELTCYVTTRGLKALGKAGFNETCKKK